MFIPIPSCVKKTRKAPKVDLSDSIKGYTSGGTPNQRWPSAANAASSAGVAYEDEFVDPLMPVEPLDTVDGGSKATGKVELSHGTLLQMQLEREEQSHQEACDKYGKV